MGYDKLFRTYRTFSQAACQIVEIVGQVGTQDKGCLTEQPRIEGYNNQSTVVSCRLVVEDCSRELCGELCREKETSRLKPKVNGSV